MLYSTLDFLKKFRKKTAPAATPEPLSISDIYLENAEFVWKTLQQFGAKPQERDDLFQEVFLIVHKRLHTYKSELPLRAWLYGITKNVWLKSKRNHSRKHTSMHSSFEDEQTEFKTEAHSPEEEFFQKADIELVSRALDALDPDKRIVLVLFEFEEKTSLEIAEELGLPHGTVRSRIFHARQQFRDVVLKLTTHQEEPKI